MTKTNFIGHLDQITNNCNIARLKDKRRQMTKCYCETAF